jgi:hypothetical protein
MQQLEGRKGMVYVLRRNYSTVQYEIVDLVNFSFRLASCKKSWIAGFELSNPPLLLLEERGRFRGGPTVERKLKTPLPVIAMVSRSSITCCSRTRNLVQAR